MSHAEPTPIPSRLIETLFLDQVNGRTAAMTLAHLNVSLESAAITLRDLLSARTSYAPGTAEHDVTVTLALRELLTRPLDEIIHGAVLDNPAVTRT